MENPSDQRVRKGHQLWIALIPLVVGGFILLSYVLWSAYRDVWAEAGQFASSQSSLLEARFDSTLRRIDATLDELAERLPREALVHGAAPLYRAEIEKDLERQQRVFPEVAGFRVVDAAGQVLYLSGGGEYVSLADRSYFLALKNDGGKALQFSEVVTSRITGRPTIAAARAVRTSDGRFLGVVSAAIESELIDLPDEDAKAYLADLGVSDSGVNQLIKSVYSLLGLQTYLTTGEKETRAWTITKGMKAPQAAGVIHGDFERGFIAGQIVAYEDLVACGSEAKAREAGKLRIEGKEYVMRDGDVVEWRFNV